MKIVKGVYNTNISNEVKILEKLNHPNIVRLIQHFYKNDDLYLVLEYAGKDLGQIIDELIEKNKFLDEKIWKKYFYQLCLAIEYLKNNNIIHRDIKPSNIFLNNGIIKLGDFGISKIWENNEGFAETVLGTPYYLSPEIVKGIKYTYKTDIWGLGISFYEIIHLKKPFSCKNLAQIFQDILNKNIKFNNDNYSKKFLKKLNKTIKKDPDERPDIKNLLKIGKEKLLTKLKDFNEKINININFKNYNDFMKQNNIFTTKSDLNKENNNLFDKKKISNNTKNKSFLENKKNKIKNLKNIMSFYSKEDLKEKLNYKEKNEDNFKQNLFYNKKKNLKLTDKIFNPSNNTSQNRSKNTELFLINKLGKEKFNTILNCLKFNDCEKKILEILGEDKKNLLLLFNYIKSTNTPSTTHTHWSNFENSNNNLNMSKKRNIYSKTPFQFWNQRK